MIKIKKEYISKESLILFLIPVIISIYMRFGMASNFVFFFKKFFNPNTLNIIKVFYEYIFIFLVQVIIPIIIIKKVFKEKLTNYGLKVGDYSYGFKIVFVALIPIAIVLILTALIPDTKPPLFHYVYPAIKETKNSLSLFFLNSFFLIFYYFAFEFFYRGFILFGLKDKFGVIPAILIQTIPSVIIHFNKPDGELFASIIAEIFFGFLAIKTNSIYYGLFIHYFIGVGIELATILF